MGILRCALVALACSAAAPHGVAQTDRSVAVLPLENSGSYGRDKDEFDALRRGLAGMLGAELTARGARVVSREQVQKLVDAEASPADRVDLATASRIGKALGARYVVSASFVDLYGDFRIDANIIDVTSGAVIKVVRSDPKLTDRRQMFRIVQSVAGRLAESMQLSGSGTTRTLATEALVAYARGIWYLDRGDRAKAATALSEAVRAAPDFAEAKAELARIG
ncbi:MAG: hypothetical protein FJ206_08165 [Gemmatimonadetes bacterium]|nr:hypothetical protein [Gemmatimonadota bacterium]